MMEKCVICNAEMEKRQACNPFPIRGKGKCCLLCDHLLVTPARMMLGGMPVSPQIAKLVNQLKEDPNARLKIEILKGENRTRMPSKETVESLRTTYKEGTRVQLVRMEDPYTKLRPGDKGTVQFVDDTGSIHIRWDKGEGLAAIWGVDEVQIIN